MTQPDLGLHGIECNDQALGAKLLRVRREEETPLGDSSGRARGWPLAVADAYVRGCDLVASYQPTDDWPYTPQVYWRADELLEDADNKALICSLSLLVSVQTHLLDTRPRIVVSSDVKCAEAYHVSPSGKSPQAEPVGDRQSIQPAGGVYCVLRRLIDLPISYAEITPATDFHELQVRRDSQGDCHVEWELFGEFLEKGVIRRARIEAILLPREHDVELAAACCQAVQQLPLALTT